MCHFIVYKRLCLSQVLSSYMPYLNESPNLTKAPTLLDFGESLSQRAHKVPADAPGPSQWVILLWCGHRTLLHPLSLAQGSTYYIKIKVSVFRTLSFKTSASHLHYKKRRYLYNWSHFVSIYIAFINGAHISHTKNWTLPLTRLQLCAYLELDINLLLILSLRFFFVVPWAKKLNKHFVSPQPKLPP